MSSFMLTPVTQVGTSWCTPTTWPIRLFVRSDDILHCLRTKTFFVTHMIGKRLSHSRRWVTVTFTWSVNPRTPTLRRVTDVHDHQKKKIYMNPGGSPFRPWLKESNQGTERSTLRPWFQRNSGSIEFQDCPSQTITKHRRRPHTLTTKDSTRIQKELVPTIKYTTCDTMGHKMCL
jgi:hypothetical protein